MATAKKKAVKKAPVKKTVAKKTAVKKAPVKKTVAKKTAVKKAPAKKTAAKRTRTATTPTARKRTASRATTTTRTERSSGIGGLGLIALAILVGALIIALVGWVRKDNNTASAAATAKVVVQNTKTVTPTNVGDTTPADDTPTDSNPPAGNPATPPSGTPTDSAVCELDKGGTWSEGNDAHRIEIGGHGGQHADLYPAVGVKSISFVVSPIANPEGVPNLYFGYGSLWTGDSAECQNFDWLTDASAYALARLDSGHSGLVIQWGTWKVLANVNGMSADEVEVLLDLHRAAMQPTS